MLGYFSAGIDNNHRQVFFITFNFENLITEHTRYKNRDHPSFILKNRPCSFRNFWVFVTGLSRFLTNDCNFYEDGVFQNLNREYTENKKKLTIIKSETS